jgi:hypothetical protein
MNNQNHKPPLSAQALRAYQVDTDIGIKGIGEGVEHSILLITEKAPEKFISSR